MGDSLLGSGLQGDNMQGTNGSGERSETIKMIRWLEMMRIRCLTPMQGVFFLAFKHNFERKKCVFRNPKGKKTKI